MSVRSTSVLTKNPTRSSSALSVRPAIGLPIGMSLPAPSRVSSAASAACSTMNRLAPLARASPSRPAVQLRQSAQRQRCRRDSSPPPAAAGRSAARSPRAGPRASRSRTPAGARSRSPDPPPRPAPRAATACSRHTAPAGPQAQALRPLTACRVGAREIARQRRQRPAVAGDVMQQQQQHVLVRAEPQTDAPAAAARWRDRSRVAPALGAALAASAASADRSSPSAAAAPRLASRICWRGTPSVSGKMVRRLSCRATRSPSAASSAATSSAPLSRTASGIV